MTSVYNVNIVQRITTVKHTANYEHLLSYIGTESILITCAQISSSYRTGRLNSVGVGNPDVSLELQHRALTGSQMPS